MNDALNERERLKNQLKLDAYRASDAIGLPGDINPLPIGDNSIILHNPNPDISCSLANQQLLLKNELLERDKNSLANENQCLAKRAALSQYVANNRL